MRGFHFACAIIVANLTPVVAQANDSHEPDMQDPSARARDKEAIRQLNLHELAMVRERDARYAQGRRAPATESTNSHYNQRDLDNYARNRAQYESEMAAWRRAVKACRAGDYSACAN